MLNNFSSDGMGFELRLTCPWGCPGNSDSKESACNTGDLGSIPGSGRSPGEGNGYPLQYSYMENPMDRGAWWATVHGVAKSQTGLMDYQIQAHSACCTRGQWIQEMRGCGKEETLIGESADQEDGRLVPQNNPLTEVWVPGSLLQIRDGGVGEEAQWKGHLSCKHLLEWQASGRGCVNFILPAICRWTGFWTKAL